MEQMLVSTIVSVMVFLGSAAIALMGWQVIFRNAKKLASRNELFNRKSRIIEQLNSISSSALLYWTSSNSSTLSKNLLQTELFIIQLEDLKNQIANIPEFSDLDLSTETTALRKSITLDAEQPNSVSIERKREKIALITSCSTEIKQKLRIAFERLKNVE